ncbi:MAG TPA: 23S rRNA (adenine(2030)-N(6))-methyltransferase RlmJ [Geminicoccaceae bacterium]|nr:23S rRNA (adenine(2030)-N(6))-methyltransferase RlmJ [Geminicoccus sp.]HMU48347.1 23S rRNA (adenine(2030)-N(6))-methyltransferase RlmJ [Geminicoccaceae bacterium]
MLGYRHGFHAGGPADVLKHAVYCFVLDHVLQKPKPVYMLDTHAGAGVYSLRSEMAEKTGEWRHGIGRLLGMRDPPELFRRYLALTRDVGRDLVYPGSPELARRMMRPQDRLELAELHPADHGLLADRLGGQRRVRVARTDGLALLIARMPPPERRAVVMIDPSYELADDDKTVAKALALAARRLATGVYLVWYPVIERARTERLVERLRAVGPTARIELCTAPDSAGRGMTGSGVVVVNPPWTLVTRALVALNEINLWLDISGPVAAS